MVPPFHAHGVRVASQRSRRARHLLPWVTLLSATLACQPAAKAPPPARHVVLVTIDTLRADHVGVYGGDVPTPAMDRVAAEGAVLEQVSAHVPLTRPSHMALFTGRLPTITGIRDNTSPAGPVAAPMLAEVLREAGFTTGGFVSSVVVSAHGGFDRGFDRFSGDFAADPHEPSFLDNAYRGGRETLDEALAWLRANRDARHVFLWLHLYDPHDPYEPPEPFASRFADRPYAGEVAYTDTLVGQLDDTLAELGLRDDTVLAITADHGEGLGEHGEFLHGFFTYESTLHVPAILRGPGIARGHRIARPSGLVDLFPTVLSLLAVAPPIDGHDGVDLANALRGNPPPPVTPVYAESLVPLLHFGWSDLRVVRDGNHKYIQAPRPELYDLADDPGELNNILDDNRPAARSAIATLATFLDAERAHQRAPSSQASPSALLEQLGALGYVGGTGAAETTTPGADPKDKIAAFRRASDTLRDGLRHLHTGEHADAAIAFQNLLDNGIASAEIHFYLGRALLALTRHAGAAAHFGEAAARAPAHVGAWLGLAEARAQLGDAEGALDALRDGRTKGADPSSLQIQEGRLRRLLGDLEGARRALAEVVERDPREAQALAMLGEVLRDLGEFDGAIRALRTAVEVAPDVASYWNALGMTLGGTRQPEDAEVAFREACRLAPDHHLYTFNLGLLLLRLQRPAEARAALERTLELKPNFGPARDQLERAGRI